MAKTCIFTIVSRNYLHYARTLMNSIEQHAPEADRVVGLCDKPEDFDFSQENFDILEMASLDIPMIDKFIFRYTILELNTAIKPYIISALFQQGYDKVIYFDPDICVYDSLDGMLSLLEVFQAFVLDRFIGFNRLNLAQVFIEFKLSVGELFFSVEKFLLEVLKARFALSCFRLKS